MKGNNSDQLLPDKKYPQRTIQQNKALHVLFSKMATSLNDNGLYMKRVLTQKPEVEIKWSGAAIKECLWRPIQQAQVNKNSTTKLTTVEIDEIFDTINKFIGESFGLHVPFPSIQDVLIAMEAEEHAKSTREAVSKNKTNGVQKRPVQTEEV